MSGGTAETIATILRDIFPFERIICHPQWGGELIASIILCLNLPVTGRALRAWKAR
jgi:hypothetical protein